MNGKQVQTQPGRQSHKPRQQSHSRWARLEVQGLRFCADSSAAAIPGQGTKVPHAQCNNSNNKQLRPAATTPSSLSLAITLFPTGNKLKSHRHVWNCLNRRRGQSGVCMHVNELVRMGKGCVYVSGAVCMCVHMCL